MKRLVNMFAVLALAGFLPASVALADTDSVKKDSTKSEKYEGKKHSEHKAAKFDKDGKHSAAHKAGKKNATHQAKITGEILREKDVVVRDSGVKHRVVQLRLDDGQRATVDLGPVDNLDTERVKVGEKITVKGKTARAGNRPVFVANECNVGNDVIVIQRVAMTDVRKITGTIVQKKNVAIRNAENQKVDHVIVMLRTEDGSRHVVDLGRADNLKEVALGPGQKIDVNGKAVWIGAEPVIIAERLVTSSGDVHISHWTPREESMEIKTHGG